MSAQQTREFNTIGRPGCVKGKKEGVLEAPSRADALPEGGKRC
jgi:hypothetical protein